MTEVEEARLMEFVGKVVTDWGAVLSAPLVVIGDRLGLYEAMADGEPVTAAELAARTQTAERYVREWLGAQAASGYVTADGDDQFHLSPEQAIAFTDESSPACVLGGFEAFAAATAIAPRIAEAFRSGEGVGWHEHQAALFHGTARFFRPGYAANLVESWIPALDGLSDRLAAGVTVADVGCGYGHSTMIMAQAYPNSTFVGYDYHPESIEAARKAASEAGLGDRVRFEVASATQFPGEGYELITYFDCLHDMGDPGGALTHARSALAADGYVLLVEPFSQDALTDNLNPVGRVFYSVSTLVCTPASLAQDVGTALGAQAGEARTQAIASAAGFTRFRRAAQTPFNIIYEARP